MAPSALPFVPELQAARAQGMHSTALQAVVAAVAMSLYAVRRSVIVLVVNPIFMVAALAGAIGASRLSPALLFVHYALSFLISLVTLIFVAAASIFGSAADSWILLLVHAPLVVDIACGVVTYRLATILHATRVRFSEDTDLGQAWLEVQRLEADPRVAGGGGRPTPVAQPPDIVVHRVASEGAEDGRGDLEAGPAGGMDGPLCLVCFDRPRDGLLYPCGHRCTCTTCGRALLDARMTCPVCRRELRDVVRIWE